MTRDVIIRIKGLQYGGDLGNDETEIIAPGVFFEKEGRCFVKYDEVVEGFTGKIQNLLKFDSESLTVTKRGLTNANMVFEQGKMHRADYQTPFGSLSMGTLAKRLEVHRSKEEIRVDVAYDLELNYEHLADCEITVTIQARDKKEAHLLS